MSGCGRNPDIVSHTVKGLRFSYSERLQKTMPIYEYQATSDSDCSFCGDGFEIMKKINDPELVSCPSCGRGVTQIISAPNLSRSGTALDARNIEKHGFTQYKKSGKGVYEKTAGKGPNVISADSD